ncbi:MAG: phenylalanine--tRNA ligase subunit beta [Candidatus Gracilibacteria bacterium]|nr:phenylalanine--tRNA ligase subunit beta [Candidatus Gracilibacteria bacterium]
MKIPLSWISLYTDVSLLLDSKGAKELGHMYSIHTAEIDGIEKVGLEDKVVIAKVVSTRPHPDSDHLNLVVLDCGPLGALNIVCGAENVRTAKYVAVALVGAKLGAEQDFEIKSSKIRGEVSEGMICSEDELGLQEERVSGIMQLERHFSEELLGSKLGTSFYALEVAIPGNGTANYSFPLQDTVFEIDNKFITNRPDLFSCEGNAREFGAVFSLPFKPYTGKLPTISGKVNVNIETPNVLSYDLVSIENIQSGTSPLGMDQMLRKAGLSPKFDLVDITNYIMTELGQPMHAFDADKVVGDVTVRQAYDDESVIALDSKEYTLTSRDIVIADSEKILAVAGVIGGMSSAISETTKHVYFESACFDPVSIRLTSQRLAIRTDASMRFEKSLDPTLASRAMPRVFDLLKFLGKPGTCTGAFSYLDSSRVKDITIATDLAFVQKKLGLKISKERAEDILTRLGFDASFAGDTFSVKVPSWRATKDISIKEDIVEEIGRINGYELVPNTPITGPFSIATKNASVELRNRINAYFSAEKFFETYNYSFSNQNKDALVGYADDSNAVHIQNAFNVEYTMMRRSMIPNLLEAVAENLKQQKRFSFFEIGKVFEKLGENKFSEKKALAGVLIGQDMKTLRTILDGFLRDVLPGRGFSVEQGTENIASLHPNKSGRYMINGEVLISFGSLHPGVAESFGLANVDTLLFEVDYQKLADIFASASHKFSEIGKYPGITRELNFVFNETTPASTVIAKIASVSPLLSNFSVVDEFRDSVKIGDGKKSISFSFLIQDLTKTTTDEEALAIQEKIIAKLEGEGIELRK